MAERLSPEDRAACRHIAAGPTHGVNVNSRLLLALLDAADEADKLRAELDQARSALAACAEQVEELDRLRAQVERVRALHRPIELWEVDPANGTWVYRDDERVLIEHVCEHCTDDETLAEIDDSEYTIGGRAIAHPCPTICALDGTDEGDS